MGAKTEIEWTDATWNPFGGCSVTSPGCTNCYAMRIAGSGRLRNHPLYAGVTTPSKAGPVFNGRLTAAADDADVWTWPLRWRGSKTPKLSAGNPSMIFVGDMADLFHEDRPDTVIDRVFAVMALAPHHTFQVLTKRPERMHAYLTAPDLLERIRDQNWEVAERHYRGTGKAFAAHYVCMNSIAKGRWPLPNVWLGVSVEDQATADERIPLLLDTPAAKRFISVEPLLGPVDVRWALQQNRVGIAGGFLARGHFSPGLETLRPLDWVIVGGESGPHARDNDFIENARSVLAQCHASGVAYFGKQNVRKKPLPIDLMPREFPA